MKKEIKKRLSFNKYIIVLAACFLIGLIVTFAVFYKDSGRVSASSSVLFAFDGAANGVTPSGDEFDISGIGADDVLYTALEECNLQEKYTLDQIRGNLYIRGIYPEDIASQILSFESLFDYEASKTFTHDGFHATRYDIALYNDFDRTISREQLGKLLDAVMISYQRSFKEQYSKTWDAQLVDLNLEEYDYIQQLSILNDRMDQVDTYASQMYQKEFRVMLEGQTFNDIHIRIRNLSDNEIPRLRAMVVLGGLSKNPERLLMQYEYEIENLLIQLRNQKDRLTEVELLLEAYEKNEVLYIGSGDAFTKIDGNSSQTYDQLVAERRSVANGITDIKTDISDRLLRMGDILGDEADSSEYIKQVNDMLAEQIDEEEYQQILDEVTEESGENPEDTENGENVDTEGEENGEFQDEARLPKDNTHISTRKGRGDSVDGVVELEADINGLVDKISEIENDFKAMLDVYNEQQFNDMTISLSPSYVNSKRLVSGAFVKTGIKYAGPFVSIGIMICVVMVLLDMKKKEKAAEKEVVE